MSKIISRRDGLKALGSLGVAGLLPSAAAARGTLLDAEPPMELQLTAVSPITVRISLLRIEDGATIPVPNHGTLTDDNWPKPQVQLRSLSNQRRFRCGELRVEVSPSPLTVRITDREGRPVQTLRSEVAAQFAFLLGEGPLLGLGQGGPQFDRKGSVDSMKSGQGGYKLETHGARVPVQWLVGTSGWAMFIHHPVGAFDLSGREGRFIPHVSGLPLDVFVIGSDEPATVMREYARITGFAEMPPLWSLGYQQSHRTLGSPEEILGEAKLMREKKLPCDAMIYLGTGFCPNGWNSYNGEFTWNARAFPDPAHAMKVLHDADFKVVLHVVVEGRRMTGRVSDPCTADPLPSGRTPDGEWPPHRQVACYWPHHKALHDLGVDGWWPDQGDGLDAPSRLARNRMYFEGQQLYRPNQRVYALHRNGFAGMQRFAAFLWSGDVQSRWETLANHLPIAVNTGLSGIPYWGTDIGGFVATDEFTGELYARWFQFGAFNPLFRSHGRDWRLHTPWGWTTGDRGFPETAKWHPKPGSLKDERIEPICKAYLELRYRLTPYLYSAVREACDSGMPIVRGLWLHHPDDPVAVRRGDQYLYGRHLLVAPVVEKGATRRRLYLPAGLWHDFWTSEPVDGGREIDRPVDLATMPLYVRSGTILPLDPVRQHLGELASGPTELRIYPGSDGEFTLYEDDGKTFDYKKGAFSRVSLHWSDASRRLKISRAADGGKARVQRDFSIGLASEARRKVVRFTGRPLTVQL